MSKDTRDTIEVLKAELDFIEKGGYGRSVLTPWKPVSLFRDSLSCLNFCDTQQTNPCSECLLIDFVPPEEQRRRLPCHHIPLNEARETADTIERGAGQQELEAAVKGWLRSTIKKLEGEEAGPAAG
jgi:hypothetical protein